MDNFDVDKKAMTDEEAKAKLEELSNQIEENAEEMVQDNVVNFKYKDVNYRIRKPNFGEKKKINSYRVKKQVELLSEKDEKGNSVYRTTEQLIALYAERGVNIEDIDKDIRQAQFKLKNCSIKLGEALADKCEDKVLNNYKKEILQYKNEISILSIKKSSLLEFALENQLMVDCFYYLTFLLAEKEVEGKWIKAWETLDNFLSEEEILVNKASFYASCITTEKLSF